MTHEQGISATLASLGIGRDELLDRVVDRVASQAMRETYIDGDGCPRERPSQFSDDITEYVKDKLNERVLQIAQDHILPKVTSMLDGLLLQPTNKWGEKAGPALTPIEYFTARIERWLTEEVDHEGKDKEEAGYGWRKSSTRVAMLVHKHLHYNIEQATKAALADLNSQVAKGIEGAVKIKLEEVLANLKVKVAP